MLKSLDINRKISAHLSVLRFFVAQSGSQCLFDIHKKSEDFFCEFFNEIYNLGLVNLNTEEKNYEGIDLGDKEKGVSYQITAQHRVDKIKKTLKSHLAKYKDYPNLKIFIIGEKSKGKYKAADFDSIVDNKFVFDKQKDINDINDLISDIDKLDEIKASKLLQLMNDKISDYIKLDSCEPIRLNEQDIKELVLKLGGEIDKGVIADLKKEKIPLRKKIEDKNIVNNLPSEYFNNIVAKNIKYHAHIRDFLSNSVNSEILNCYNAVVSELQEIYISKKDKYESITNFFQEVYSNVEKKFTKELGYDKRKIFTILHYMYFNCDLGINP